MPFRFDHLAVSGLTRDAAKDHVEAALGIPLQTGGEHPYFGTHNHLLGLEDGLYLEAISIDPGAPKPNYPRWFDLDAFDGPPRLTNWICATQDVESLPPDLGVPIPLTRGDLRWEMVVPASGKLPFDNLHPAIIKWHGDLHPAEMLRPSGLRLIALHVQHPQADALRHRLGDIANITVQYHTGDPALAAEFDTPHGRHWLR